MIYCIRDMLSSSANSAIDHMIANPSVNFIARVNGGLVWSVSMMPVSENIVSQLQSLCLVESTSDDAIIITPEAVRLLGKANDPESQRNI